ncbi:uncharacterized protein LOC127712279 isoform X2 [Mytilus californianus]|uniref:uncharacterized protein LOC127712279 isoform X2 n=1 Tax=Mytilus californianus TaxID=6549 RepID=UPI0022468EA7|nr:uncharacterized protein LOC127712279 isoform X2 [Mytilus californianus]
MSSHFRRKSSPFVHLIMTSFTLWALIGAMSCAEFNVTWNMKTNPAIIGNNVILECVIFGEEHSCDEYPRQWYGGVNYGLLCEDGMCRNNKKYKELNISSCIYRLVIHNFTEQDLNQNYTCSYGIFNERKGLTLKDGPFELQPSNESVHKTIQISDDSISVHLEMSKVYPMPSCTFSYEDANTTEYVKKSVETVGSFFKVNFNYTITDKCEGKIMISCTTGSHLMNISQNCPVSGGDRQSRFSVIIIVGIVTCVGAMVFLFAAASCFVLYRRQRCGLGCRGNT